MTTQRFKLPVLPAEADAEERTDIVHVGGAVPFAIDGRIVYIAQSLLTEVAPPIPDEPAALGHYLIGGTHFEKVAASQCDCIGPEAECWEMVKGGVRYGWSEVWRNYGGPEAAIAWLVPVPAVSLPWRINGIDGRLSGFTEVRAIAGMVSDGLGNQTVSQGVRLTPDEAEQKAAALIAGAHQARAEQANVH